MIVPGGQGAIRSHRIPALRFPALFGVKGTIMNRLALALFPMVATTLMGIAVVAVLTMDIWATGRPILWAALGGFVLSIPVSWWIGRQITAVTRDRRGGVAG